MSLENCSNEHNIDFIAKSFFVFMVSISFVNDLYSIKEKIYENEYVKKNINKFLDITNVFKNFLSNKEKKTKDGFIIKKEKPIQKEINKKNTEINIKKDEIKQVEISSNVNKKKKKIYNNDLMQEANDNNNIDNNTNDNNTKDNNTKYNNTKETKIIKKKKKVDSKKESIEK